MAPAPRNLAVTPESIAHALTQNATVVALALAAVPVVGTLAAWIGRGGATDEDGKFYANVVIGVSALALVVEFIALYAARLASGGWGWLAQVNLMLVAAPPLALAGSIVGIRRVFPLNELAGYRTLVDVGIFVAALAGVAWLLSKFHWGVIFFGSMLQLLVVVALGAWFLRRLYRRAITPNTHV